MPPHQIKSEVCRANMSAGCAPRCRSRRTAGERALIHYNRRMLQYLVLVGAAVNATGSARYIRDTLRGGTKPNRVTYLMWGIAPLIAAAAAWSRGVTWAVLPVFMSGFCPLMVFLSSFVNGQAYWKLGKLDY